MESMTHYVIRKLKDPQINIPEVAKLMEVSKMTLYTLVKNRDGKASLIEKLYYHFKQIGE